MESRPTPVPIGSDEVFEQVAVEWSRWLILDPRIRIESLGQGKSRIKAGLIEHFHNVSAHDLALMLEPLRTGPVEEDAAFLRAEQVCPGSGAPSLERLLSIGVIERSRFAPVSKMYARVSRGRVSAPLGVALRGRSRWGTASEAKKISLPTIDSARASWRHATTRSFQNYDLSQDELSELFLRTYGCMIEAHRPEANRATPSAGGVYPLELLVRLRGDELLYRYDPDAHALVDTGIQWPASALSTITGEQGLESAAAICLCVGDLEQVGAKYFEKAYRFLCLDAGHTLDQLSTSAQQLGLGSWPLGAFDDDWLAEQCPGLEPLYAVALGKPLSE